MGDSVYSSPLPDYVVNAAGEAREVPKSPAGRRAPSSPRHVMELPVDPGEDAVPFPGSEDLSRCAIGPCGEGNGRE